VKAGGSLRRELRDRMLIVEVQHLRYVMTEYRAHHGIAWPQQVVGDRAGRWGRQIALQAMGDQDRGQARGYQGMNPGAV
jgi:hypothetical protein